MPKQEKCLNPRTAHVEKVPDISEFQIEAGYFKQGDDFAQHLERCKNKPVEALEAWGIALKESGEELIELSRLLKGKKISVSVADSHMVQIKSRNSETRAILRNLVESKDSIASNVVGFDSYWRCEGGKGWETSNEPEDAGDSIN